MIVQCEEARRQAKGQVLSIDRTQDGVLMAEQPEGISLLAG
jgi:hypothetical protein